MSINPGDDVSDVVRVVLADDNSMTLDQIKRLLPPRYEVVGEVHDGASLLEAATRLNPDLAIVDIYMPRLTGLQATTMLREMGCQSRILILTVTDDADIAHRAIDCGASGYVVKSHMVSDLAVALEAVLQGRQFVSAALSKTM